MSISTSRCADCEIHQFLACKNGFSSGCHKGMRADVSPLYGCSDSGFGFEAMHSDAYGDAVQTLDQILKMVRDTSKDDVKELRYSLGKRLAEAQRRLSKVRAQERELAAEEPPKLIVKPKPKTVFQEFQEAARRPRRDARLAQELERQFKIWNAIGPHFG